MDCSGSTVPLAETVIGQVTLLYRRSLQWAIDLRIVDDGRGFNPEQNIYGFGIQGMRERTAALGGQFNLVSEPGQGCLVEVIVPMLLREWDDDDSGVAGGRSDYHSAGTQELAGR